MCFTLIAHCNINTNFSPEMVDLCSDFIKLTVEKIDSRTQVVPRYLKFSQ